MIKLLSTVLICLALASLSNSSCVVNDLDIVWLLDESGSVGRRNYDKVKRMIADSSLLFPNTTCLGAVEFSGDSNTRPRSNGNVAIPMDCDITEFNKSVMRLVFNNNGWTYTKAAMEYMSNTYFVNNPKSAERKRVMIVVTDGYPRGRGDKEFGDSDQKGEGLINSTNVAIDVGGVDRFIYVAVGTNLDLDLFNNVTGFNKTADLFQVSNFDELGGLVERISEVGCGIRGIVLPPQTQCSTKELLYVNDHSHSVDDKTGFDIRDITDGFFSKLTQNLDVPKVSMGTFAGDFQMVLKPTFNTSVVNKTMGDYVENYTNGRRKYTNFVRVSRRFSKMFTGVLGKRTMIINSDGKPFLRNKKHHVDKVMDKQCDEFKELQTESNVNIICVQHGRRTTPTTFFECACSKVLFFNNFTGDAYHFGSELYENICE